MLLRTAPGLFHLSVSNAPLRIASLTRSILSAACSIPATLQEPPWATSAQFFPECRCPIVRRQVRWYSVDSSVRIEAPPAAIDSEVHVQTGDFISGEVATVSDDLPLEPDLRVYP